MSSRIAKSLTIAAFAATLAACSSVPLDQSGTSGSTGGSDSASAGQVMDPFNPQSPLAQQRSVYFDFDSYSVPDQYRSLVEMHSSYLASHAQQKVLIEGNADARGGSECYRALRQRRSSAVSPMMTSLGVNSNQIGAIGCGNVRPTATGSTGADFAERRSAATGSPR